MRRRTWPLSLWRRRSVLLGGRAGTREKGGRSGEGGEGNEGMQGDATRKQREEQRNSEQERESERIGKRGLTCSVSLPLPLLSLSLSLSLGQVVLVPFLPCRPCRLCAIPCHHLQEDRRGPQRRHRHGLSLSLSLSLSLPPYLPTSLRVNTHMYCSTRCACTRWCIEWMPVG